MKIIENVFKQYRLDTNNKQNYCDTSITFIVNYY